LPRIARPVPGGDLSHYFDSSFGRQVVKIKPGEFFVSVEPLIIATVLGSCVAACVRDPVRGTAGMNHFMLPEQGSESREAGGPSLRYGLFAMESLINEFIKNGSARRDLEVKVFGGGAVVDAIHTDVGAQNARFIINYLAVEGIRIIATDLGGSAPRKIYFFVEDGRVLVKYLWRLKNDTIGRREAEYARALTLAPRVPQVELF
jgi:chemotaxis protein CheD